MSIPHNFTFDELLQKITQRIYYGTRSIVTHIDYLRPMRVVNNKLIHDTAEIKTDSDVAQMIKRWKEVQRLDLLWHVPTLGNILNCLSKQHIYIYIYIYIYMCLPTRDEMRQELKPWFNTDPWGVKFKYPFY